MELSILHAIQNIRTPGLDKIMVLIFSTIVGSNGQIWVYLGILAFLFPKTRRCGICMLVSYLLAYFLCDNILKELIARPRPFVVDDSVSMLVKKSSSFSCPSVHSALAFATASAVFFKRKDVGIAALIFAALVGFSRLYFFVHYPTDVLLGAVIGFFIGWFVTKMSERLYSRQSKKKKKD